MRTPPQGITAKHSTLKTIFLDRDGVINRKMPEGEYVTAWEHFDLIPGVAESIAALNKAGFRAIVVTNQRGIALGLYTAADVDAIHTQLNQTLAQSEAHIDAFYFCPHDKHQCNCRKPLPGLFEQARYDFPEISAASSIIIGDSLSDIEFGRNLGMKTIFIEGNSEHRKPGGEQALQLANQSFANLSEAVDFLLS